MRGFKVTQIPAHPPSASSIQPINTPLRPLRRHLQSREQRRPRCPDEWNVSPARATNRSWIKSTPQGGGFWYIGSCSVRTWKFGVRWSLSASTLRCPKIIFSERLSSRSTSVSATKKSRGFIAWTTDGHRSTRWSFSKCSSSAVSSYTRPGGQKGMVRKAQFVYDGYYDCWLCPEGDVLGYATTSR